MKPFSFFLFVQGKRGYLVYLCFSSVQAREKTSMTLLKLSSLIFFPRHTSPERSCRTDDSCLEWKKRGDWWSRGRKERSTFAFIPSRKCYMEKSAHCLFVIRLSRSGKREVEEIDEGMSCESSLSLSPPPPPSPISVSAHVSLYRFSYLALTHPLCLYYVSPYPYTLLETSTLYTLLSIVPHIFSYFCSFCPLWFTMSFVLTFFVISFTVCILFYLPCPLYHLSVPHFLFPYYTLVFLSIWEAHCFPFPRRLLIPSVTVQVKVV